MDYRRPLNNPAVTNPAGRNEAAAEQGARDQQAHDRRRGHRGGRGAGASGGGPYAVACAWKLPHRLTHAGVICGMLYLWLTFHKKRLGDAITAHAITNFLLGIWVVWKGAWQFW